MKTFIQFIFCCVIIFLISCSKDKFSIETCEEIPLPTGISTGYQWTKIFPYYDLPCLNPNNPDEIVLRLHENYTDTIFKLIKYNLSTKTKKTIYEGNFLRPRWSRKDWIIFNSNDYNIYKIKSNGDSLTQLTTLGICFAPEWNLAGDKFIYYTGQLTNPPSMSIICNENGIPLDTIIGGPNFPSWQHDSLLINLSAARLFYQNPITWEYEILKEISVGGTSSVEWFDNENVIWSHNDGIFSTNIFSKETRLIKSSCDAQLYKHPTVSFESQKVIFQRDDKEVTGTNKGTIQSRLFIMNFDGSCELEIEVLN